MRTSLVVVLVMVVVGVGAAPAVAGVDADVTKAFTGFVTRVAAGKPLPPGLEVFITPFDDEGVPADLAPLAAMLPAPKVKVLQVMASKSGRSAWIAAEVTAQVTVAGKKPRADAIRSSAFLAFDGAAWTVRAVHWSIAVKNVKPEMCGDLGLGWQTPDVSAALAPAVKTVLEVLDQDSPPAFAALLSDDKRSLVFGSAPRETFAGGARIKGVFKKWSVSLPNWDRDDPALPATAGLGPDGELGWMATRVAYFRLCTSYRTLFVLAKEKGAWKIVHQHYSEPTDLD